MQWLPDSLFHPFLLRISQVWSVYCLLPAFLFCLTIIDAFLCIVQHLEHAFPMQFHQPCLIWKHREVPGCLASSIELSTCVSRPCLLLQGQEKGYSALHQLFLYFLFQMLSLVRRLLNDCQQTCIITMGQRPALARPYFKTNHRSSKHTVFWMIFSCCNTAYSLTLQLSKLENTFKTYLLPAGFSTSSCSPPNTHSQHRTLALYYHFFFIPLIIKSPLLASF